MFQKTAEFINSRSECDLAVVAERDSEQRLHVNGIPQKNEGEKERVTKSDKDKQQIKLRC